MGLLYLLDHPAIEQGLRGFKDEITKIEKERSVRLSVKYANAFGDLKNANSIVRSYLQSGDKAIVALTTPCAQIAKDASSTTPVIFVGVSDPIGAGLVSSLERGEKNITGTTSRVPNADTLSLALRLYPRLRRVGILYSVNEANSRSIIEDLKREIASRSLPVELVTTSVVNTSEMLITARALASRSDALFAINDNGVVSSIELLIRAARERSIPIFAADIDSVKKGAYFTYGLNYEDEGRAAARLLERVVIDSQVPGEIPVYINQKAYLYLNSSFVASRPDLPQDVLREAEIVGDEDTRASAASAS